MLFILSNNLRSKFSGYIPKEFVNRITLPLLTFLFLLIFQLTIPQPVIAATTEEQVESLINSERQKRGLMPYNHSEKLYQASLNHNTLMSNCTKTYGRTSCFKHQVTLLGEKTLMERIKATGYNPQAVAENIAWGYTTSSSVVTAWMSSTGHRANILGSYKDIGCDYLSPYWTCDFGKSFTFSTTTVTPAPAGTITPTLTKTPTPTTVSTPTSFITQTPTSIIPTPTSASTSKPWWCVYVPSHSMCR